MCFVIFKLIVKLTQKYSPIPYKYKYLVFTFKISFKIVTYDTFVFKLVLQLSANIWEYVIGRIVYGQTNKLSLEQQLFWSHHAPNVSA